MARWMGLTVVAALGLAAALPAGDPAGKKPLGTWTKTAGDALITFEFTKDQMVFRIKVNNNEIKGTADYGVSKDGVVFGQQIVAVSVDTFAWGSQADVMYVRGDLAGLSSYGFSESGSLAAATSLTDPSAPSAGTGFYYLVRLAGSCVAGSWQSVLGDEPGRDLTLP